MHRRSRGQCPAGHETPVGERFCPTCRGSVPSSNGYLHDQDTRVFEVLSSSPRGRDASCAEFLDVAVDTRAVRAGEEVVLAPLERHAWAYPPGLVLVLIVGLVATIGAVALRANPSWPTECQLGGHRDWCAEPSLAMSNPALATLAHGYCPKLSTTSLRDVVAQPLSQMDLANQETFAKIAGSASRGTEDVLLGEPGNFAWVTRTYGGESDGLVEIRCPGDTRNVPGLALKADQFRSTLAASNAADGIHIDFAEVARQSVATMSTGQPTDPSFGFLTCDTDGIDLSQPQAGRQFSCMVEIYGLQGKGGHQAQYRVTDDAPFFEPDLTTGQS